MLEARLAEQRAVLDQAARLVKPGGRLAYITCSVLPPENRDQVEAFLTRLPAVQHRALAGLVGARLRSLLHRRNRPTGPARRC